ncbi:MAG: 16S rRNA (adenine(1518)-N(6)/adenine(1519)-N(6))-dimethyltransferase RsmA [Patescibacteria group bacterium]
MTSAELKFLLNRYKLSPNKLRGQNFLVDDAILDQIIYTAQKREADLILEVGPGMGALTQRLILLGKPVVALEIENNFKPLLDKLAVATGNLEIIWQDIMRLSPRQWQDILARYKVGTYQVVANIPYYLTGKFIQKFMTMHPAPSSLTLLLQKEVAERLVGQDKKNSLLSLAVGFYGQAEIICLVDKKSFYPAPQVDSALVYIYNVKVWSHQVDEKKVWQLVKRGFAQKRKKLFNNLLTDTRLDREKLIGAFAAIGLDQNVRAEDLSVENWLILAKKL